MKPVYSVVIPVYNEEEVLNVAFSRIDAVMQGIGDPYELIFVNDGSKDGTAELVDILAAQHQQVKVLHFARNFGHQIAVTAGLDAASGDAVVIIDCDLQDPPEVIVEMAEQFRKGYDVVHGKRIKREGETLFKKVSAWFFYRIMKKMVGFPIEADAGDFRLISKRALDAVRSMPEHNRYLRGMFAWVGFKQTSVSFYRAKRYAGKTKYSLSKMITLACNGILSFSLKPLDWVSFAGAGLFGIGIFWLLTLLALILFGKSVSGTVGLAGLIILLSGAIVGCLGVVAAYIGRIYDEVKGRPLYLIAERRGFEAEES